MNIKTETLLPNLWFAWDQDDTSDPPLSAAGYGKTEQEAIDDLKEQISESN